MKEIPTDAEMVALDMIQSSAIRYNQATGKKCRAIYMSQQAANLLGDDLAGVFGSMALIDDELLGVACYAR